MPLAPSTLVDLLRQRAEQQGEDLAYAFLADGEEESGRLSYSQLDRRARAIAGWLQEHRLGGQRVLLLFPPGLDYIAAFFGCLYAGSVAVPVYPPRGSRGLDRLQVVAEDAQAQAALTVASISQSMQPQLERFPALQGLLIESTDGLDDHRAESWKSPKIGSRQLAFLQYTSGSTAAPKGVMVSHANLLHNAALAKEAFGHDERTIFVGWLPLYHDMGLIGNVLQPLFVGIPSYLMPPMAFLQKPLRWLQAVSRYRATTSGGPDFAYSLCARKISREQKEGLDLSSWKVAFNGAEPVRAATLDRFARAFEPCGFRRQAFYPCYGLAESTLLVSGGFHDRPPVVCPVDSAALAENRFQPVDPDSPQARRLVSSGRAWNDLQIAVVDPEDRRPCPSSQMGEIWVRGPSVAGGYWNRRQDSADTYEAHLASGGGPFLRSGDLGFMHDGELFVTGRLKDMIIIRGLNYYPQDIERTVAASHPALREDCSAAFALEEQGEERLAVVQEVDRLHRELDVEEVSAAIRQAVSEEFEVQVWAVSLIRQASLPRTTSGKVQRGRCRQLFLDGQLTEVGRSLLGGAASQDGQPALREESFILKTLRIVREQGQRRTLLELHLRQVAAQLCGLPAANLDAHTPLQRLGLDSLGAVELRNSLEADLGVSLPLADLLRDADLAGLAAQSLALLAESDSRQSSPARQAKDSYPLSPGQEALWFEHRLNPRSAAYNIAGAVRLLDADLPALRRSFEDLVQRHAALRTRFEADADGQPCQKVEERVELPFRLQDASGWSDHELHENLQRLARRPFDLSQAPLLRIEVLRLTEGRHLMLLAVHHIVSDLWSLGVLLRDLGNLYAQHLEGTAAALDPLAFQFCDHCSWQRQRLEGSYGDRMWEFWKKELAGELPDLQLPADHAHAAGDTSKAAFLDFRIDPETAQRLREVGHSQGATHFVTLLSAFQALLHRLSGQQEVLSGSPVACRNRADLAGLAGYFVNPLPLRADFKGDPAFDELLQRQRRRVLDAFEYQEYPFPWLVQRLAPQREAGRTPLFEALFTWQMGPLWDQPGLAPLALGMDGPQVQIGALDLKPWPLDPPPTPFKLHLAMARDGDALLGRLQYDAGLFEDSTARRWTDAFRTLLQAVVQEPTRPLSQMPWLSEAQKHHLLKEWNDTQRLYPAQACIPSLFEAQAAQRSDAVALASDDGQLSYFELNRTADHMACQVELEAIVGVLAVPGLKMIIALLGILKAGGAYLPLDPAAPPARGQFQLEDAGASLLTAQVDFASTGRANPVPRQIPSQALAYVIYTSGSTGRPKGVAVSHRAVLRLVFADQDLELSPTDRVSQLSSPVFDVSAYEIWGALLRGARLVLIPPAEKLAPKRLAARLRRQGVSVVNLVPSLFKQIVEEDASAFAQVDALLLAGEVLPPAPVARVLEEGPPGRLLNVYGPTENAVFSTCFQVREAPRPGHSIPIGRPISNSTAYVLGPLLEALLLGASGELYLGGDGLARGYLGRAALTAEQFVPHPYSLRPGERLYRSGDRARWRPDGLIEFLGRIDDQIKLRGFRVELAEIEYVLEEHPLVCHAVVLLRGEQLVGYVQRNRRERRGGAQRGAEKSSPRTLRPFSASSAVISPQLRHHLQRRLPGYMIPALIVEVDKWPRTASGKIDRKTLPLPAAQPINQSESPQTPLEELVSEVWREVLGVEQVGREDDFFGLGGHSLLAIKAISRLEKALGREIEVGLLFEAPTPQRLAKWLEKDTGSARIPAGFPQRPARPPLSFAQQRLWFVDQFLPGSPLYNFAGMIRLQGRLDEAALKRSLRAIVQRHESLRTAFAASDEGEPWQQVHARLHLALPLLDLSALDGRGHEEALRQSRTLACLPFDLSRAPLMRCALLRCDGDRHHLLLSFHHSIFDGASLGILLKELQTSYNAAREGMTIEESALPVQYVDFTLWQRRRLTSDFLRPGMEFWRRTLNRAPARLDLPCDRPRPAQPGFAGRTIHFVVPAPLVEQAAQLGRRRSATLFMTLTAAFQTLLHRLSSQTDIVIGAPVANRDRPELQGLIGLLVNNLVLRTDLSGNPPFQDLLERQRQACLQAYLHQDVPFEQLVEELSPERETGRNPFYQVVLGVQESPLPQLDLSGLEAEIGALDSGTSKFDLSFFLQKAPDGLEGLAEFSSQLFDATTVQRWIGAYRTLLQDTVQHPRKSLSELDLFDPSQRHQLLLEWNANPAAKSPPLPVLSLFSDCLRSAPDSAAMVQQESVLSYAELGRRSAALASWLRRQNLPPESPVAVLVPRSPELIVAFWAVLQSGGVYLPLDPDYPSQRIAFLLQDSGATVLLTHSSLPTDVKASCPSVLELDEAVRSSQFAVRNSEPATSAPSEALDFGAWTLDSARLAYLIYTSGSTGRPKGSMISHGCLAAYNRVAAERYQIGRGDRVLQFCSISFDASIEEIVPALTHGATLVLRSDEMLRSSEHFWRKSAHWAITAMSLPTAFWHELVEGIPSAGMRLPQALKLLIIGGERAIPERLAVWRQRVGATPRLVNTYGLTESTVLSTIAGTSDSPRNAWEVSIGRPVDSVQIYLLDSLGGPVSPGALGELCIGGAFLGRGYHRLPSRTAERFVPSPFSGLSGDRLYRTGDLARHRPDGELEVLGRIDQQVKLRGFRVELGEIEARLEDHPAVEKAVVRIWEEGGQKRLAAYMVRRQGEGENRRERREGTRSPRRNLLCGSLSPLSAPSAVQSPDLRSHLRASLPSYMLPSAFVELERLPLTPNGKVDRLGLPRPSSWGIDVEDAPPIGATETRLAEIWGALLKIDSLGRRAHFFEQGGHSLLAVQMASRIRKAFGVELPVRTLFDRSRLFDLAAAIDEARPQEEQPLLRVDATRLSYAQQRLWFLWQLAPESPLYNISGGLRLRGELDAAALRAAIEAVAQRHQPLRSRFLACGGKPVLKVVDDQPAELPLIDLSGLNRKQCEAESLRVAEVYSSRPFDLARTPPYRAALILQPHGLSASTPLPSPSSCLLPPASCLLLTLHHIVCDAWSMGILARELAQGYGQFAVRSSQFAEGESGDRSQFAVRSSQFAEGESGDRRPGSPKAENCELRTANRELTPRYSDYADWQRRRMQGRWMEQQIGYWQGQLSDAAALDLPTDRKPGGDPDYLGAAVDFAWPQHLAKALMVVGQRHQATLFMTLLAAFQALLFRYTGQDDVSVGTPVTNRSRSQTEGLIGLFVNTLVLRTRLPQGGAAPFSALLSQVRETALEAFAHSEVPFERVVEELQPERSLHSTPLFRVLFALENAPHPRLELPGLQTDLLPLPVRLSKFDLNWTVQTEEKSQGDWPQLEGRLTYRSGLFEEATIRRLLGHLQNLAEGAAANEDCPLGELPLLSRAQLQQLCIEPRFRDSAQCIPEVFAEVVERRGDAVAVVGEIQSPKSKVQGPKLGAGGTETEQVSYRCLMERGRGVAAALVEKGVGPESVVALEMERSLALVEAMLGVLHAGGAYLPLDPDYPAQRLDFMGADAGASVTLTDPLFPRLPLSAPLRLCVNPPLPDQIAYLMYTSGSTGIPKGVAITHRGVTGLVRRPNYIRLGPEEVILQFSTVSFDASTFQIWGCLLNSGRLVLMPPGRPSLEELDRILKRHGITLLGLPAAMFRLMAEHHAQSLARLPQVLSGGDVLSPAHARMALQAGLGRLINGYGPTENTTYTCCCTMGQPPGNGSVPIGAPVQDTSVYLLDDDLHPVPHGVAGELFAAGTGLARGYWKRPAWTAERFVPHPFALGQRLYRTGDRARWIWRGEWVVEFLGRLDQQVKVRGFRVEPAEVEAALCRLEGVRQAVVMVRGEAGERSLAACVVGGKGEREGRNGRERRGRAERAAEKSSPRPLRSSRSSHPPSSASSAVSPPRLRQLLPDYMIPSPIVELDELPLTPNGKVDRKALLQQLEALQPPAPSPQPLSPTQELLAGIWSDILQVPQPGLRSHFFELGGHSLLATQMVSRVRQALSVELPLKDVFEAPTLEGLSQRVDGLLALDQPPAPPIKANPVRRNLPLSFAQQRLWFLDQFQPGSPAYNVPAFLTLSGNLDIPALQASIAAVVRRHEVLRTRFPSEQGHPIQFIDEGASILLPLIDLGGLEEADQAIEQGRLIQQELRRPFDLNQGPLLRAVLIGEFRAKNAKTQAEAEQASCLLLASMHHIVSDAWSAAILIRELATFYEQFAVRSSQFAERRGGETQGNLEFGNCEPRTANRELPSPLPIQYSDFARWQRDWLGGEVLERQIGYWKGLLRGVRPLELPSDRPRPAAFSHSGGSLRFRWTASLLEELRQLSRSSGVTLFMTLLTGFQAVLQRWSGQSDFGIGCPIANRNRAETEHLIGFFVNTLVMRLPLRDDLPFRELLAQARKACLEAYAHQDVPFEQLVEELQPERSLSRSPLFQVMFALQNAPREPLRLQGLRAEPLDVESTVAKFDLALALTESEQGLEGILEFSRDLLEAVTMRRLLGQFENLLRDAAAHPHKSILQLSLMNRAESHQALREFNATDQPISSQATVLDWIGQQEERRPESVALTFADRHLSFGRLRQLSLGLSATLRRQGAAAEIPVGVLAERSLEMVSGMLGVLRSGAPYLPLDPSHPAQRLAFQVRDAAASLVVAQSHLQGLLRGAGCTLIDLEAASRIGSVRRVDARRALPSTLAYLIYTSGSTGRPKGVGIQHDSLLNLVRWQKRSWAITPQDRAGQVAPITFDASVWEIWPYLAAGASVHIADDETRLSPPALQRWLIERQITLSFIPTPVMEILLKADWPSSTALRSALTGGDKLSHWPHERLPFRLVNNYGPTEYTAITTSGTVPNRWEAFAPPIGHPIDNTRLYVLDRQLRPQPLGVFGELFLAGCGIARGYWRRPQLTAAAFLPNPFGGNGSRIYRSGDLVRWRADGQIDFLGRCDRQVQIRGLRIEPGEIEAVLGEHPEVAEAAVVVAGERLAAFVVGREGERKGEGRNRRERRKRAERAAEKSSQPTLRPPSASSAVSHLSLTLVPHLHSRLPAHMIPSLLLELDALPLTANGKVDRRALQGMLPESLPSDDAPLRTPVEQLLAGIWEEVLGVEGIGSQDHFFELGGHSLLATQVTSRVRSAFGVEIPVAALFEHPKLADLAQRIQPGLQDQGPRLERRKRDGDLPLSFAQQRLWFLDQLQPTTALYNIPAALRLEDGPHPSILEAALNEIVRRHETLRTSFPSLNGRPIQRIQQEFRLDLPMIDLSALGKAPRRLETERLARQEARRPFDLATGPVLRAKLIKLQSHRDTETQRSDVSVLLLTLHHIAADGWSMGILLDEMGQFAVRSSQFAVREGSGIRYRGTLDSANCEPRTANCELLPPLPLQYADFACWQREWLSGARLERQTEYWRKQLLGIERQELPADRSRPARLSDQGASWSFRWPAGLCTELREFSRSRDATLFMTLLASLQVVLGRWSEQMDVAVGVPVAGRNRPEIEELIGFFVNTLVMRADLGGNPTFEGFLHQVRRTALDAYAHQDLPFEQLVEELQPERSLDRTPLFQLLFMLQNVPGLDLKQTGLGQVSSLDVDGQIAKFDLSLSLLEEQGQLMGTVTFRPALFDAITVQRLMAHWRRLTEAALTDAQVRLDDLPLLSQGERHQIVQEWNDTQAPFSRRRLVHELFEARCTEAPERVALICDGPDQLHLTFVALRGWAESLAQRLVQAGVGSGQTVGLCLPRGGELICSMLAVLKAGAAYVPAEPNFPRLRIKEYFRQARAGLCLTTASTVRCSGLDDLPIPALLVEETPLQAPPRRRTGAARAEDLAYVLFTSGSTGRPKGVAVQHRAAVNLIEWVNRTFDVDPADHLLFITSPCFDLSVYDVFGILSAGASVRIASQPTLREPQALARILCREGITVWDSAPAAFEQLLPFLRADDARIGSLRLAFLGGDWVALSLPAAVKRHFPRCRVVVLGGATEVTIWSSSHEVDFVEAEWRSLPYGRPLRNYAYHILDPAGHPCPAGVPGDLVTSGQGLSIGYLHRPALTAERFCPHPFSPFAGDRLYRTGDRARWMRDGNVEFLGRLDQQVQLRGYRIELGEVEAALTSLEGVQQAVVVMREGRLVAFVCARRQEAGGRRQEEREGEGTNRRERRGRAERAAEKSSPRPLRSSRPSHPASASSAVSLRDLLGSLEAILPHYMVPSRIFELDELPLTPNRKIDRKALLEWPLETERQDLERPASPIQELLAGIWSDLLRVDSVGAEDDFFALGGHSLLATQMISRIQLALGADLPLRTLFQAPRLSALAARVEAALRTARRQSAIPPLERIPRDGDLPLSFAQQRRWFLHQVDPFSSIHNIPAAVLLTGQLDIAALQAALSAVVRRHEVLRSVFPVRRNLPVQQIRVETDCPLPLIDLSGLNKAIRENERNRLQSAEVRRPFDLAQGPLLRAVLIEVQSPRSKVQGLGGSRGSGFQVPGSRFRTANCEPRTANRPKSPSSCLLLPASCLLLTMHHIVSDGWSMSILVRELTAFYQFAVRSSQFAERETKETDLESSNCERRTANCEPSLPPLPFQYVDFAAWQRRWLQGELLREQVEYWKERLRGAADRLELPTDRPFSSGPGFRGRNLHFRWPLRLLKSLYEVSRRHDVTLYMTLLACFQTLLGRWSGQRDISTGTPIANRNRSETEGLIGYFVNTLVMRSDLSGNPRFDGLLAQVRETALQAYAHQDVPFEQIVEALKPERALDREPLFQVMLALQNAPPTDIDLPGLKAVPQLIDLPTAHFDLTLALVEGKHGLQGALTYNGRLFDPTTVRRFCRHLESLLDAAAADPQARIAELPLWTEAERHQVLVEWNPPQAAAANHRSGGLASFFEQIALQQPDSVAAVYGPVRSSQFAVRSSEEETGNRKPETGRGEASNLQPPAPSQLSYSTLDSHAGRLAAWLQAKGIVPEIPVGIAMEPCLEMLVAILGVLRAGGAYLPLDVSYPPERQQFMLQDAQAPLVLRIGSQFAVRSSQTAENADGVSPFLNYSLQPTAYSLERAAYVIYTSGSTGRPKGVVVSHRNALRLFEATRSWFGFARQDVWTLFHSHAFDFSVWEIWGALLHGGRLVVVPRQVRRSPRDFAPLLLQEQVTVLNQTPSAFAQLSDQIVGDRPPLALRSIVFGGEPLDAQTLRPWLDRFGDQRPCLVNMYGITETTVHVTYRPIASEDLVKPGSRVGKAISDLQIVLLDGGLEPAAMGVAAEICVGGEGVSRGYLRRPELTAQRFIPHHWAARSGERLYRSGDLGRWRPDGDLEHLGRIDRQVKIRGFRIELGEIEAALETLSAVRRAVVLEQGGKLAAFVVKESGVRNQESGRKGSGTVRSSQFAVRGTEPAARNLEPGTSAPTETLDLGPWTLDSDDLRNHLKQHLPDYMIPASFTLLDELPLTSNGKLDRKTLLAAQAPKQGDGKKLAPGTQLEKLLAEIWADVLGIEQVGIRDNFFDLGGHSMLIPLVLSQLEESLGRKVSILNIFEQPTVEALAQALEVEGEPAPEGPPAADPLPDRVAARKEFFRRRRGDVSRQD